MALDANYQGSGENFSNIPVTFSDVFSESDTTSNPTDNARPTTDTRTSPLFASVETGSGTNTGLFPSAESLLGTDGNFGADESTTLAATYRDQPAPTGDTPTPPSDTAPRRSESPITDQAMQELAQRFGISPEVLKTVKQLAEQFGLGQHFTAENVQKFLEVAQQQGLTQYMTPENLEMARTHAESMIQQHGGIGEIVARARENPEAALNMITSMLPDQVRGQATALVQGLMNRFRPGPTPNPNPNPNPR